MSRIVLAPHSDASARRLGIEITPGTTLHAAERTPSSRLSDAIDQARRAESVGYESIWTTQLPAARDTGAVLAAYAMATTSIRLSPFVLPIYTRHPTAMAQLALTIDELSQGRFSLAVGVSHRVTVESRWGLKLERPVEAMREYVSIVRSLIRDGQVDSDGQQFSSHASYGGPRRTELPILISALNPRMLELAGEIADGVALWMCAPSYIRDEVVPRVRTGRERAGKSLGGFDVVAMVPVSLTTDRSAALEAFRPVAADYASLPFYRSALDRTFGDAMGDLPGDAVLDTLGGFGDGSRVRDAIQRYVEAGVTVPVVSPFFGHAGAASFDRTAEEALG